MMDPTLLIDPTRHLRVARAALEFSLRDIEFPRPDRTVLLDAINVLLQREAEIITRLAAERVEATP